MVRRIGAWLLGEQEDDDTKVEVGEGEAWNMAGAKQQKRKAFVVRAGRRKNVGPGDKAKSRSCRC